MTVNYRQIKAIEQKNKERILKLQPTVPETSGIYIFLRADEDFKYAYVGQAKHLLTRIAQHLSGYQHKTSGSQGKGKSGIADNKPSKGYYDGLAQGYKNAQKFVANLFDKHLVYGKKSDKPNKNQEKALAKFEQFLQIN